MAESDQRRHGARRRGTGRALIRFAGAVLATSGALLVTDAAVTLAWQEPVSAYMAKRDQDRLGHELADAPALVRADKLAIGPVRDEKRLLAGLARRQTARLKRGKAIGRIKMPTLDRSYVIVHGTRTGDLRKGPGHYPETSLPGRDRTVAIAGHRTTYGAPFRMVNKLKRGDRIEVEMPYGKFEYSVERTQIVKPTALWVKRNRGYDRLMLSACHPLYSASKRIIVFARLKSADAA